MDFDELILGEQDKIEELCRQELELYVQIGREAYEQNPEGWSQSAELQQLQTNLTAAQEALDALKTEKEAAEAEAARIAAEEEAARIAAEEEAARAAAEAEAEKFRCQSCGTVNPAGTRFCQECGAPLAAPPPPPAKKFCGNCGTEIAPGVRFCGGCGAKQPG